MREIIFKNLTANDSRKQDLCIREVITRDDYNATIERRCVYFICETKYVEDPSNLEELKVIQNGKEVWKKRHFHILRNHNTVTGEDILRCKVAGTFYAIFGHYVFLVGFIQSFKIDLMMAHADNK